MPQIHDGIALVSILVALVLGFKWGYATGQRRTRRNIYEIVNRYRQERKG